eukprot:15449027-Alexandrium_andersonii.AAC.1
MDVDGESGGRHSSAGMRPVVPARSASVRGAGSPRSPFGASGVLDGTPVSAPSRPSAAGTGGRAPDGEG